MDKKLFYLKDWEGQAKGGYYFRAFDLIEFFKKLEDGGYGQVVALEFEGHNVNVIVEVKDLKKDLKKTELN